MVHIVKTEIHWWFPRNTPVMEKLKGFSRDKAGEESQEAARASANGKVTVP